ncbi:hypothetical protein SDC9_211560 [bioreactor metagenome]|uniref:Uncharacterized protein n=1 Tax=bioreactor metagenome TaxID=1076179 RepID=A0A645JVS1_9ZZZZ
MGIIDHFFPHPTGAFGHKVKIWQKGVELNNIPVLRRIRCIGDSQLFQHRGLILEGTVYARFLHDLKILVIHQ